MWTAKALISTAALGLDLKQSTAQVKNSFLIDRSVNERQERGLTVRGFLGLEAEQSEFELALERHLGQ